MGDSNYVRSLGTVPDPTAGSGASSNSKALYVDAGLTPTEFIALFKLTGGAPSSLQIILQRELRQQLQYFAKKGNEEKKKQWTMDMKKALKEKGTLGGLAFLLQRYL